MTSTIDRAAFIFGGHATFTIVSKRSGTRFTYRVAQPAPRDGKPAPFFASVLTGPDNTADYTYMGILRPNGAGSAAGAPELVPTRASKISPNAASFRALEWFVQHLASDAVEFHHCGRCARCGRQLTDPESIESGFGPHCRARAA
jgi:hypothetical protein